MADVTQILSELECSGPQSAERLLPLVYDELRALAARKLIHERPGQTLQATALVHEAYLRLVGNDKTKKWHGRAHFFAAAAEAMRRILINRARDKQRIKRGGGRQRLDLDQVAAVDDASDDDLLAIDDALKRLARENQQGAELVKLRFFAGMTLGEAAEALNMARRTAEREWAYVRAWLYEALSDQSTSDSSKTSPSSLRTGPL
jgi:RNA polymerase sigma factor (TIGR02999 family)